MENQKTEIDAQSEQGLEIIKHAFSEGGKVLEFRNNDGDLSVLDVTDHFYEMEEMVTE